MTNGDIGIILGIISMEGGTFSDLVKMETIIITIFIITGFGIVSFLINRFRNELKGVKTAIAEKSSKMCH